MKIAIAASLIASAAAFAPASQQATRSSALGAYENELGVQTPVRVNEWLVQQVFFLFRYLTRFLS